MSFHPDEDWLLFIGQTKCGEIGVQCNSLAYFSENNGLTWKLLTTFVQKCHFARELLLDKQRSNTIYCAEYVSKTGNQDTGTYHSALDMTKSDDFYASTQILKRDILGFYMVSHYLVLAAATVKQAN